jgi:uncharacterized GH25 family protein
MMRSKLLGNRPAKLLAHVIVCSLLVAAAPALAHEHWLELEPFRAASARQVKVYLVVGDHLRDAEPVRIRRRDRYTRMELHGAARRTSVLAELREDAEPMLVLRGLERAAGTHMLTIDAAPRDIELSAEAFEHYLVEERLFDILVLRAERNVEDAPGRERYSRCLKSIFQLGPTLQEHVTRPVGQEIEIVPLANPYGLAPGQSLTVQVLFRGKPLAGRAIVAASRRNASVATQRLRTDAQGRATFRIDRTGDWMFAVVHMEPSSEPGADWRSFWASLTFALGA